MGTKVNIHSIDFCL